MSKAWHVAGVYAQVLLNIAGMFFLLGLCVGLFISLMRSSDPGQATKALVPFTLALFAPIALMVSVATVVRQLFP